MKITILDTNFILTCVKQKIDFFEEIKFMGMEILIPKQVINELKKVVNSKKKLHFRKDAELSLKLLEKEKNSFKKIDLLKYGKNTDKRLKNFTEKNKNIIIATLDRELKNKIKNPKLVIREKNKLEVI
jgi:rRNA-processing protein FCF1|tara:strand:+ start:2665 stop:3048 length:384 start_codon:yes stop_codon:yes gene_type:complete